MSDERLKNELYAYWGRTDCDMCLLTDDEHNWKITCCERGCLSFCESSRDELIRACRIVGIDIDEKPTESDAVNHPAHYADGKIEVIDFIEDKNLNFNRGNAVKYIARAGKKDPTKEAEDIEKAIWYLEHELQRIKGDR